MAVHEMRLDRIAWDDQTNVVTLVLSRETAPAPPTWVEPSQWTEGLHETVTFSVSSKRAAQTEQYGYATSYPAGATGPVYTRYRWNGTAWVEPTVVPSVP